MRILYVAKHNKGCNDNEGAIKYALEQLGHEVDAVHERSLNTLPPTGYDLLLFQNWKNPPDLRAGDYPKVFWYMDRIDYEDDDTLTAWTEIRIEWMKEVMPHITMGVCTDGDWVARDRTGKLIHLMQGADERFACCPCEPGEEIPLLFTGSIYGRGEGRASFVQEMKDTYRGNFIHEKKVFGQRLINKIHNTKIVLAPDGPVTDRYTSNRAVITCSFGGFLMHPKCDVVENMYEDGREAVFYHSRKDLHEKIAHYLHHPQERYRIQCAGYAKTLNYHTYRHRLEIILNELSKRLPQEVTPHVTQGNTSLPQGVGAY